MERNRYADLLRVVAMIGVVAGHWVLISITYSGGQLSGQDALDYIGWAQWGTWVFQVMPLFFLVGGYVNALSWTAHHADGRTWTWWVRHRAMRLLWPTAVFVIAAVAAVAIAGAAGARPAEIAEAGWLVALQLWFLPVYLLLIALTPLLLAAHRRWGLAVSAVMAAAAALVNAGLAWWHLPSLAGYVNFLLVWGCMHQWGFAWQDGTLTRARWRPYAFAAAGAALLAALLVWGRFAVNMIGSGNTNPPSIALLAFAAAHDGLVLAAEPAASRLLARPRPWRWVTRLNDTTMTVYLWHFVPAIVIAVAFYRTGLIAQPAIGTGEWWELRPAWFALLIVVLVPMVVAAMRAERLLVRLPGGLGRPGPWSPVLLLLGIVALMLGLTRLAIDGFAPGGHLPPLVLAACAAGLAATLLTGREHPAAAQPHVLGV